MNDDDDFAIQSSRAVEPYFYRAPHPPQVTPMEFQFAGVEYAVARDHAIIGDAPGLGKTVETILISNAIEAGSTLVISPASLRLNWEREIWKWSTIPNVTTYPVLKSSDGISKEANYVILSYALLANPAILGAILDHRWDHVILDEAHAIKDPKGNIRTRAICAPDCLPRVTGRFSLATGTLLPNQPIEAYNAIRMLNWDAFDRMSLEDFRETYYEEGGGFVQGYFIEETEKGPVRKRGLHWSQHVRNRPVNLADFQYRLRKHLMVRRLKEQVLHELPHARWHPFPLPLTADLRRVMKKPEWKEVERLYHMDPEAFDEGIPIDGAVATARRELGEAKVPGIIDYVHDLMEGGVEKLVVAAYHRSVLDELRAALQDYGLVYMDGSTSAAAKQRAVDQFQGDSKIGIILGQELPLGEGWTLTAAQDVLQAEPDWTPGRNYQLLDRICRIGQKGTYVIGHLPIVPDTLDERIVNRAIAKDIHIHEALDA